MIPPDSSLSIIDTINNLEEQAKSIGEKIWDNVQVKSLLKQWSNNFSSDCVFHESLQNKSTEDGEINLYFAPALIFRKKNDLAFVKMFEDIKKQISESDSLSPNIESLVKIDNEISGNSNFDGGDGSHTSELDEIYFPLLANSEQLEIVRKIEKNDGVLVQGPPGTGKSHTLLQI